MKLQLKLATLARGMSSEPASDRFAYELVKLLLQVAWADDQVARAEADALLAFARKQGLSQEQLVLLGSCLSGRAPLPPPNIGLLKARRLEVLHALKELLASDLQLPAAEEAIVAQISALLR